MRIFRVLWARNGAVGFIGQLGEACSGVVGFIVLHAGAFLALGTSRLGTRWGFCSIRHRLAACRRRVGSLNVAIPPRSVTASPRRAAVWCPKCRPPRQKPVKTGCCVRSGLRFGHNGVNLGVPDTVALLLAVLTLQCAAKPYWWHGGQPAQVATYRVNVRMKGPRPPPHGLTCA